MTKKFDSSTHENIKKLLLLGAASLASYAGVSFATRKLIDRTFSKSMKTIMTDHYDENIWELVSATRRSGPQVIVETNLRSEEGVEIERPLGSPKKFPSLDQLMFGFSQLYVMPTDLDVNIDTTVIIGKKARKPVTLEIPIMVSGMAFGVALSEAAKVALAKGCSLVGTATNTGEGPFLPSERKAARTLILQYNRGDWSKTDDILEQGDMIEIQLGQGALGGVGHVLTAEKIDKNLRKYYEYPPGKDAVANSKQPEVQKPEQLVKLVNKLRRITGGVPIGVKLAAGKYLEQDLDIIIDADVDFISVEGAEAATKGSAPILQDDFGIPTIYAVDRTVNHLIERNVKEKISIIACGKLRTPGDFLKALALGADACYIGSTALFAMSHDQVLKPLPFEPPTQLVWYNGNMSGKFDPNLAAQNLAKFLNSCTREISQGVKALGKQSIHEVIKEDLMSLDEVIAKALKIPMIYEKSTPN